MDHEKTFRDSGSGFNMIFSLFASKRTKWKKRLTRGFDTYIPGLKGMEADEIGFILDQAAHIKSASLMTLKEDDPERLYWEDPLLIGEKESLERLDFWRKWMFGWSKEGATGNSKVSSMMIYFNSLGGMTIIELRIRAKEMWKELARGFPHCKEFNPKEDIPKGFEKLI